MSFNVFVYTPHDQMRHIDVQRGPALMFASV